MLLNLNKSKSNLKKQGVTVISAPLSREDSDNNSTDLNERSEDEDPNTPSHMVSSWG
jgi:hypothetical protein